jgi:hypothetical protein
MLPSLLAFVDAGLEGESTDDPPDPWLGWLVVALLRQRVRQRWHRSVVNSLTLRDRRPSSQVRGVPWVFACVSKGFESRWGRLIVTAARTARGGARAGPARCAHAQAVHGGAPGERPKPKGRRDLLASKLPRFVVEIRHPPVAAQDRVITHLELQEVVVPPPKDYRLLPAVEDHDALDGPRLREWLLDFQEHIPQARDALALKCRMRSSHMMLWTSS